MFIQTRTVTVQKGYAEQVIERFSGIGVLDDREGLVDISIMVNRKKQDNEEVVIMIRWESEDAWKQWEKSPEHIQGHRENRGKPIPEYVVSSVVNMYDVRAVRKRTPAG